MELLVWLAEWDKQVLSSRVVSDGCITNKSKSQGKLGQRWFLYMLSITACIKSYIKKDQPLFCSIVPIQAALQGNGCVMHAEWAQTGESLLLSAKPTPRKTSNTGLLGMRSRATLKSKHEELPDRPPYFLPMLQFWELLLRYYALLSMAWWKESTSVVHALIWAATSIMGRRVVAVIDIILHTNWNKAAFNFE